MKALSDGEKIWSCIEYQLKSSLKPPDIFSDSEVTFIGYKKESPKFVEVNDSYELYEGDKLFLNLNPNGTFNGVFPRWSTSDEVKKYLKIQNADTWNPIFIGLPPIVENQLITVSLEQTDVNGDIVPIRNIKFTVINHDDAIEANMYRGYDDKGRLASLTFENICDPNPEDTSLNIFITIWYYEPQNGIYKSLTFLETKIKNEGGSVSFDMKEIPADATILTTYAKLAPSLGNKNNNYLSTPFFQYSYDKSKYLDKKLYIQMFKSFTQNFLNRARSINHTYPEEYLSFALFYPLKYIVEIYPEAKSVIILAITDFLNTEDSKLLNNQEVANFKEFKAFLNFDKTEEEPGFLGKEYEKRPKKYFSPYNQCPIRSTLGIKNPYDSYAEDDN